MNWLIGILLVIGVAGMTGLIVYLRFEEVAGETDTEANPQAVSRPTFTFAFTMAALLFGIITGAAFWFANDRWPDAAQWVFPGLGIGLAILFSVGAAIVRPQENMGGVPEVIVMNVLWGLGYGGLLPLVIR